MAELLPAEEAERARGLPKTGKEQINISQLFKKQREMPTTVQYTGHRSFSKFTFIQKQHLNT